MIFGPTFSDEVIAAGLAGLPFAWNSDGTINGREKLSAPQQAMLDAVIAAHDPLKKPAKATRDAVITAEQTTSDLMDKLANASSAQIDAWFAANVTNAAAAITVLKTVVKILALRFVK